MDFIFSKIILIYIIVFSLRVIFSILNKYHLISIFGFYLLKKLKNLNTSQIKFNKKNDKI